MYKFKSMEKKLRLSADIYIYFKNCKDFGFKDQITRSSLSVASNIAEGIEKDSKKEIKRFLNIAQGSIAEAITQVYIGMEINYIKKGIGFKWIKEYKEILKMISSLKKTFTEN